MTIFSSQPDPPAKCFLVRDVPAYLSTLLTNLILGTFGPLVYSCMQEWRTFHAVFLGLVFQNDQMSLFLIIYAQNISQFK